MEKYSDYLYAKASHQRIPLGGAFELSPVCNFACKMCYVRKTPAQIRAEGKRQLDWQEWVSLAEQCHKAGTLFLLLTGGEPFLYPHFRELYIQLHKMGFLLSINTNGTLIDEATIAWLKEYAPHRVNITLYGGSEQTYERICGSASGYHRAVAAIRGLKEAGIPVVINASMIPENAGDQEAILQFGKDLGLNVRMATYMFPPSRRETEKTDSRFTPEEAAAMFVHKAKFLQHSQDYVRWLSSQVAEEKVQEGNDWGNHREDYMQCRAGRSSFWISWDGTMTACGIMPFPLQLYPFLEPFADCWNKLTDVVRTTPVLSGCKNCPRRKLCKPCVAMIYTETGTPDQKAPYLCAMAQCAQDMMRKELEVIKCDKAD